jgi:hypothetical protein
MHALHDRALLRVPISPVDLTSSQTRHIALISFHNRTSDPVVSLPSNPNSRFYTSPPTDTTMSKPADDIFTQTAPPPIQHTWVSLLITLIPTAIVLVIVLGVIHLARKRNVRIVAAKNKDTEIARRAPEMRPHGPNNKPLPKVRAPANAALRPQGPVDMAASTMRPQGPVDVRAPPRARTDKPLPKVQGEFVRRSSPLANNGVSVEDWARPVSLFHESGRWMGNAKGKEPERAYERA